MKQEKNQLKAGIILNYVNLGIGNLIPVFYTPIMLSLLGQNEYGLYKLSSSVTSYLSLISMGLGAAITRYLIKARTQEGKEAEEKMFGLFVIIFNIIAVASLAVGGILTANLYRWYGHSLSSDELHRMQVLVALMVANMALGFSLSPYISVVTSHEKFLFNQSMNILGTCVGPVFNLIVLFFGAASIGMTIVALAISIVTRFCYQIYVFNHMHLKPKFHNLPLNQMKSVLTFSFWIFLSNVVGQLYNATDTVLIGMIPTLATVGVAVYNIGIMLSNIIGSISTGVSALLTPTVNIMIFRGADGDELTNLALKVGRIQGQIALLLISGFISFGKEFVFFYTGPEYRDAYWVAIWVAVPSVIYLVQSVCLSIITAENKHQFRSIMYLFIALLNVVGTWFLMKYKGIIGAAAMTGIATVIGHGFIMNWYYSKYTVLNMRYFWAKLFPIFIVPMALIVVMNSLRGVINFYNIPRLILGIIIYSILYFILSWKFVLNEYEKNIVKRIIKI